MYSQIFCRRNKDSLYTKTFYVHIKQTSPSKRGRSLFKFISPPDCMARCSAVYDVSIVTLKQERVWWSIAPTFSFVFCYSIVTLPYFKLRQRVCPLPVLCRQILPTLLQIKFPDVSRHVVSKRREPLTHWRGIISRKKGNLTYTAAKT